MPNLRVLYENQAKRAATISASTVAGALVPTNLLNDIKTSVHRSTATLVVYTLTWTKAVPLNTVALAFTNLTAGATMRTRIYSEVADLLPLKDSGIVSACAYAPLGQFGWGLTPLGVNAFRFGGYSYGRLYFPAAAGKKLVIEVVDTDNTAGYIEAGCLIAGAYWEAEINPDFGAELQALYGAQHEESEAGDLRTERRPKRRGLNMNLGWLKSPVDQLHMHEIMMQGMETPLFVSLFPENSNPVLEQRYQMYAKLEGDVGMAHPRFGQFSTPLSLLEI